jgi:predicted ATPase
MFESLSQRTVIIGNSGAGKSALAESLAASIHVPVIDLDLLNWEGNGYGRKRDEDAARRMTLEVVAAKYVSRPCNRGRPAFRVITSSADPRRAGPLARHPAL